MGPRTHAAWLGSTVFDGARAFEGVAPDLDRHCARVNWSASNFGLKPVVDVEAWIAAIRKEEELASVAHDAADIDKWEQAHFDEDELRNTVRDAKAKYEDALREKIFGF